MARNKRKNQRFEKLKAKNGNEKQASGSSGESCDVKNRPGSSKDTAVKNLVANKCHQQDNQRILQTFPEELWCLILNKLKDPSRLRNLSNASPSFRQLLLPRRIHFLFPKMLQILAPKFGYELDYKNCLTYNAGSLCADNDLSRYRMIIKLRLVCSSWQQAVDQYYDNHWLHYQMKHDPYDQQYCEKQATIG